jgi:hypothetical protein
MKKLAILSVGTVSLAIAGLLLIPNLVNAQGGNGYSNGTGSGNGSGSGYGQMLTAKAQALGMTQEELQTQLKDKTMAQIIERSNPRPIPRKNGCFSRSSLGRAWFINRRNCHKAS